MLSSLSAHYKFFKTSTGVNYSYINILSSSKPTILFLHGFPSSANDWRHQINFFAAAGYGIIAPDCLGYGGSDKPLDMLAYKDKLMAEAIIEILDHEAVQSVLGVAHDWGSQLLSRLANYHSTRFLKYAFLDVPYSPPRGILDRKTVEHVNEMVEKALGYQILGYVLFFGEEDAAELMNAHPESVNSLFLASDPKYAKEVKGPVGALRKWLEDDSRAPQPDFITDADTAYNTEIFSAKNGGFTAALNWYRSKLENINAEDEKGISEQDSFLHHSTLFIACSRNPISAAKDGAESMRPYANNLTSHILDTNHWVQLEDPDAVNKILMDFFLFA